MTNAVVELTPVEDRTLRAQVSRQIMDMVTGGHFTPGQKLTETDLANRLRVSRAPLREAIRELVNDGVLMSQPYKGLQVRPISRKDVEELYSMRTALEKFAFSLAWPHRNKEALSDLKQRHDALLKIQKSGDQARTIEHEIRFHSWVYEVSEHSLLLEHWKRLATLVRIYMALHHNLHGSHGEYRAMSTQYMQLAHADDLSDMLVHIDEHMKQGLQSVQRAL